MSENFSPAILIPVYKHAKACRTVVKNLAPLCVSQKIPVILVDDGNSENEKLILSEIESENDFVHLVSLEKNGGKGKAFSEGVFFAKSRGISHILQIDADGQHDFSRAAFFLEKSAASPSALICGFPEYDESAPNHRKNAHRFANLWCKIVTWESGIVDSLCGFRVYPVEETARLLKKSHIDSRMGFDIDILIRLIWRGVRTEFYGVRVTYPEDGISNFRPFRDNVRISWVFTKFFCGMILRSPILLARKLRKTK